MLRESSTTKPAGAAQACLLPSFPERLGLPTPLGARQLPPSPTFPSEARAPSPLGAGQRSQAHSGSVRAAALWGESGPSWRRGGRSAQGGCPGSSGRPSQPLGPGLSLEPCSQPHSCCCPRRLGFSHAFVGWTFCRPGVTPGVRAAGWPPCLQLQEALSSSPSASSAGSRQLVGWALLTAPASPLCASKSLAFVYVACSPHPPDFAPWPPSLHPVCRAAPPLGYLWSHTIWKGLLDFPPVHEKPIL